MVQPLPRVASGGRPEQAAPLPPRRPITTGKYEEFRTHLRKLSEPPLGLDPAPTAARGAPNDASHLGREMSPEPELSRRLAPEGQPSVGGGPGELAEWFSLINPAGGVDPALLAAATPAQAAPGALEVAELVERWVRRAAVGGDHRRGAVRLELGQGRFSGAELLVVAEAGRVSVELNLPPSLAHGDLSERLRARLEGRGFEAEVVVR
jgi:hypothetical protein